MMENNKENTDASADRNGLRIYSGGQMISSLALLGRSTSIF